MKKVSVILFFFLAGIGVLSAQTTQQPEKHQVKTPQERAEAMTKRMTTALSLNDAQASQVKTIFLEQSQKMADLRAKRQDSTDKTAMREEMQNLRASTEQKLKGVLTPDQYAQYQQMREDRMEHRKGSRQHQGRSQLPEL